jgi:hypothetical protein
VQDLLFFETVPISSDGTLGKYGRTPPAYGTKHPDVRVWPNHELVFVAPIGNDNLSYRFYYAAERENQDDYNYELRDGQELVRTYVIKRGDYDSGATDEFAIPAGGTLDTLFPDYGFAGDSIVSLGEPLSSLYIGVQRRYIVAVVTEQLFDPALETTVNVTKTIKPSGYVLSDDALVNAAGSNYEVRHGNNYHDVLIARTLSVADLLDRELATIYGAQKFNFPPRLDSADMVYRAAWVTRTTDAGTSAQFSEDFYFDFQTTPAATGPFKTVIERWVTADPDTIIDTILAAGTPLPQAKQEDISVAYSAWSEDPAVARAVARQYRVPPSFHGSVAISVNGTFNGVDDSSGTEIGATTVNRDRAITPNPITAYPAGFVADLSDIYLIDVDVQKTALDMFIVTATSIDLTDGIFD